jgi:hypothetical protein
MPKGPKGEKRPADVIGNAVKVMRIAVGEDFETAPKDKVSKVSNKSKGGKARAAKLSPASRKSIAKKAAKARWQASPVREKIEH